VYRSMVAAQGEFGEVALVQSLKTSVFVSVHHTSPDRPLRNGVGQGSTDEFDLCRVAASFNKALKSLVSLAGTG